MFYYAFLILVLLIPLRNVVLKVPSLFGLYGLSLINILYFIVFVGVLLSQKTHDSYRSKLALPLILYVIYFFLQIYLHPGNYSYGYLFTWWKDAYLFMLIPFFFVARSSLEPKKVLIILVVMCVANVYMDTYFWRWVRWFSFATFADKMKSVNGTFGDVGGCNEWAAFFSTYTLVILAVSKCFAKKWVNISLKMLAAANIAVLMFTFSRGGYAGFVAGLVYLLVKSKKYLLIILLLFLPVFYATVLPHAVVERIQMSFQTTDYGDVEDKDVESRLVMWQKALDMSAKAPIIGNGLLSFSYLHWRNPHNQHLNILVQGGLVGYVLFLWLFIAAFRDAGLLVKVSKDKFSRSFGMGMVAATFSLFVANIFGDRWSYYVLTGYFWVLNGIVCLLINISLASSKEVLGVEVGPREDEVR